MLRVIDDCKGDLRRTLNELQKLSMIGVLKYSSVIDLVDIQELMKLAKSQDWYELRKQIEETELDCSYVLERLFDYIFEKVGVDVAVKVLGDYFWRDGVTVNRKLNLFCCFYELSRYIMQGV